MSTEEIIRAWKAEGEQDENAPANPAGEQELSDEELENVEGGLADSCGIASCNHQNAE